MPSTPSAWRQKIYDVLADGQWHSAEDVIKVAVRTIPPGVAARASMAGRPTKTIAMETAEERQRIGARQLCMQAIWKSRQTGKLEIDPPHPSRTDWERGRVRLRGTQSENTIAARKVAELFGVNESTIRNAIRDPGINTPPPINPDARWGMHVRVDDLEWWRRYCRFIKLTHSPWSTVEGLIETFSKAGWSEDAEDLVAALYEADWIPAKRREHPRPKVPRP